MKWAFRKRRYQFRSHACDVSYNWDWRAINKNRIALVNLLISLRGGLSSRYLEIGCCDNALFDAAYCDHKVGVDPEKGGNHRQTSDDFFRENTEKFDVIFVDGLHEYHQVKKDAVNVLEALADGGWIAFHDFLPRNWKEHHVPRLSRAWTGDCWKLAVELANSPKIDFRILNIDHGVGVMRPRVKHANIVEMYDELHATQYDHFVKILPTLPCCDWTEGIQWITRTISEAT